VAYEQDLELQTFEASADLSAAKYTIMKANGTARQIAQAGSAEGPLEGVLVDDEATAAGMACSVAVKGRCPVKRGAGTFTPGTPLMAGANGLAVPAASQSGELIVADLKPEIFVAGAASA
jgi:hypothetical protein